MGREAPGKCRNYNLNYFPDLPVKPLSKPRFASSSPADDENVSNGSLNDTARNVPVLTKTDLTFDFHRLNILLLRSVTLDNGMAVARKIATATMTNAKIHATVGSYRKTGDAREPFSVSFCFCFLSFCRRRFTRRRIAGRITSVGSDQRRTRTPTYLQRGSGSVEGRTICFGARETREPHDRSLRRRNEETDGRAGDEFHREEIVDEQTRRRRIW